MTARKNSAGRTNCGSKLKVVRRTLCKIKTCSRIFSKNLNETIEKSDDTPIDESSKINDNESLSINKSSDETKSVDISNDNLIIDLNETIKKPNDKSINDSSKINNKTTKKVLDKIVSN